MKTLKVLSSAAFSAALIAGAVAAPSAFAAPGGQGSHGGTKQVQANIASSPEQSTSLRSQQQRPTLADATTAPDGTTPVVPTDRPTPPTPGTHDGPGIKGEKADIIGQIKSIDGDEITITAPEKPAKADSANHKGKDKTTFKNGKATGKSSVGKDTYAPDGSPLPTVGKDTYGKPQGPLPAGTTVTINVYSGTDIVKTSHDPETGHVETAISLSDLKVGDNIAVTLASDDSKQATKMEVHEAPKAPANGGTLPTPPTPKDGSTPPAPPTPKDGSTPPTPPTDAPVATEETSA